MNVTMGAYGIEEKTMKTYVEWIVRTMEEGWWEEKLAREEERHHNKVGTKQSAMITGPSN